MKTRERPVSYPIMANQTQYHVADGVLESQRILCSYPG